MTQSTIYYLRMDSLQQLIPGRDAPGLKIMEAEVRQYQFNQFLYEWIGESWQWNEKRNWTAQRWRSYAERDALRTWVAYVDGSPAGYYELERHPDRQVNINYFGLAPAFIGKGLGGALLTTAIRDAWHWDDRGVTCVTVNTCSLDHPSALANYQARGFSMVKTDRR